MAAKKVLRIIVASTRPVRAGGAVGDWVYQRATEYGNFEVQLTDLRELNLPFLDEREQPSDYKYEKEYSIRWSEMISASDAFIFVIPEYNHSFTAPFKNALDILYKEWHYKPAAFVSYGGVAAGIRATQAAKPVLNALKMTVILNAVPISFVKKHIEDGKFIPTDTMNKQLDGVLGELERVLPALELMRTF